MEAGAVVPVVIRRIFPAGTVGTVRSPSGRAAGVVQPSRFGHVHRHYRGPAPGQSPSDALASKGRSEVTGEIFEAVPEGAVTLDRGAYLLGSRVIALSCLPGVQQ